MSTTVKSLFVTLSLSAMCNVSSSQISYAGPAGWEVFRELSEVEDDAKAELCLYSARYWNETPDRIIRSDKRVFNKCPEALRTVLEQRFKEQAVKKTLERPVIKPVEDELLSHAVDNFVSHELARVAQHKRPSRRNIEQKKQSKTVSSRYTPRETARATCTSNVAVPNSLISKKYCSGRKNKAIQESKS